MGDVAEEWPYGAGYLAAGRLDFDDVGPQIAHQLTAELALFVGQLQYSQARQGAKRGLDIGHFSISSM
jgi:hypothetical protein